MLAYIHQIPTLANTIAAFDEVCRLSRARVRNIRQMLPYVTCEARSAIENELDCAMRICDRLHELRNQIAVSPEKHKEMLEAQK